MSIKDLIAKVTGMEQRAEAAFKAELETLKAQITGTIQQLQADLATAQASIASLTGEKTDLASQVQELTGKLSDANKEYLGFNGLLTSACLNGKLLDLKLKEGATEDEIKSAALAVPVVDKFKLYQGALNAAFAKANLPNSTLPTAPATPVGATGGEKQKLTLSAFRALNPRQQSEFCALVRAGHGQLMDDPKAA